MIRHLFIAIVVAVLPGAAAAGGRTGSAVVVHKSGIAVTARHAVAGCRRITVTGRDGHRTAEVLYEHHLNDIAVLKIARGWSAAARFNYPFSWQIGDTAHIFGYPRGGPLEGSQGIVIERILGGKLSAFPMLQYYRISAAIEKGYSGGPVLDRTGAIIGVISAMQDVEVMRAIIGRQPAPQAFTVHT